MKVEPSRPPKGICFSARPPIQKSTVSRPVMVAPLAPLAQAPVLCRKSRRSTGSPMPPSTSRLAAARLAAMVVAPVMLAWVP
ncbi:hypothetical protein D9M71_793130 [compost metagenome]